MTSPSSTPQHNPHAASLQRVMDALALERLDPEPHGIPEADWEITWHDRTGSVTLTARNGHRSVASTTPGTPHVRPDHRLDRAEYTPGTVTPVFAGICGVQMARPRLSFHRTGDPLALTFPVTACLAEAFTCWMNGAAGEEHGVLKANTHVQFGQGQHPDRQVVVFTMHDRTVLIDTHIVDRNGVISDRRHAKVPVHGDALPNALNVAARSARTDIMRNAALHADVTSVLERVPLDLYTGHTPESTLRDGLLLSETELLKGRVMHGLSMNHETLSITGVTPGVERQPDGSLNLHSNVAPFTLDPDWCLLAELLIPAWQDGYTGQLTYSWSPPRSAALSGRTLHLTAGPDDVSGTHLVLHEHLTGSLTRVPLHSPATGTDDLGRLLAALHRRNRLTLHDRGR